MAIETLYDRNGLPVECVVVPDDLPPVLIWGSRLFILRDSGLEGDDPWRYIEVESLQVYRPEEWDMRTEGISQPGSPFTPIPSLHLISGWKPVLWLCNGAKPNVEFRRP